MPAIHLLGGDSVGRKTFRYKSPVHGRVLEFIPERGMISTRLETENGSEEYDRISRRAFLERAQALQLTVKQLRGHANSQSGRAKVHLQEAVSLQRLVDCMVRAAREAWDQGDPIAQLLAVGSGRTAVPHPTFESYVPPMPRAPDSSPITAGVVGDDPRSILSLPPGVRRQLGYTEG